MNQSRNRNAAPMGAPIAASRLGLVFLVLLLLAGATAWRLISIQLIEHERFSAMAEQQYTRTLTMEAERGVIADRQGRPLVENMKGYGSVAVRPDSINGNRMIIDKLAGVLNLPVARVRARCQSHDSFVWLDRQVLPERLDRLEDLNLKGVEIHRETRRGYPYGAVAGQVVGHVSIDGDGGSGLEKQFDHLLKGRDGWTTAERDALGRARFDDSLPHEDPVDGGRVTLTLDIDAQAIAEEELARGVEENDAVRGMVVITRPLTGEILAMASWPGYDPNRYSEYPLEAQKNRTVTDVFEPGSTFKIVPFAGVLERGLADIDQVIDTEDGRWHVAGTVFIHDTHDYDTLSVRQGFAKSSNILTGKLAGLMSQGEFYTVMRDFGFGQHTGIDFLGEVKGLLPEVHEWSGVSQPNMAMGQGVAVTAMQLAMAYGAIANSGQLMRPLLVRSTVDPDGVVQTYEPQVVRTVMSPKTARIIRKLMVEAVEAGTGGQAILPGVQVAGKTGTAQKPYPDRPGYMKGRYVSSFAGFLPAGDPEWLAVVVIDDPQGQSYYGGSVAGPVFRRIMQRLLVMMPVNPAPRLNGVDEDPRALPDHLVMLPSLQSCTKHEALAALEGLGLQARFDGEGQVVVAQSVAEGHCLTTGDTVVLTLGCGTTDGDVLTPDLRRKPLRDAVAALTRCGLKAQIEGSGMVVEQIPRAGERLAPGGAVRIVAEPLLEAAR